MSTIKDTMKELVWREYPGAVFEFEDGSEIGFSDSRWGTEIHFYPNEAVRDADGSIDRVYCCAWVHGKVRFLMPGEW